MTPNLQIQPRVDLELTAMGRSPAKARSSPGTVGHGKSADTKPLGRFDATARPVTLFGVSFARGAMAHSSQFTGLAWAWLLAAVARLLTWQGRGVHSDPDRARLSARIFAARGRSRTRKF